MLNLSILSILTTNADFITAKIELLITTATSIITEEKPSVLHRLTALLTQSKNPQTSVA